MPEKALRTRRGTTGGRMRRRLALLIAVCVTATLCAALPAEAKPKPPGVITVVGTARPEKDVRNINRAIRQAGKNHKTVRLVGHFDVGDLCVACIRITKPVTIVGTGDPTVPNPNEATTTIIEGGRQGLAIVPFLVFKPGDGEVNVSRLWFRNMTEGQLWLQGTSEGSKVRFSYNRFTELRPAFTPSLSFPMAGGWSIEKKDDDDGEDPDVEPGDLDDVSPEGEWQIDHNYADVIRHPFFGDQDCIATAHWSFSKVTITDNTLKCDQDVVELEGGINPDAEILIARNDIVQSAAPSPEGILYPPGGHPEAIKVITNLASSVRVIGNEIDSIGTHTDTAVCILFASPQGSPPPFGSNVVADNTCNMSGVTAGLLAGYTQAGAFYSPAGTMQNTLVIGNTFRGTAKFGIAFLDYAAPPGFGPEWGLVNDGNGNVFVGNHLSGLVAPVALQFGAATHDNLFVGDPGGPVVDLGTNNVVVP
jgi:hypothetical protein